MDNYTEMYLLYGKTGDPLLFEKLYEEFKRPVLSTIMRITGLMRIDSEEILQEVFIKVIENRKKYEPRAKFSTWLFGIAVNRSYNRVRDTKNNIEADETLIEPGSNALEQLMNSEKRAALDAALQMINLRQRTALVLREFEEKTYEEIASIMQISLSAVESLIFHARTNLRGILKGKEL